LPKVTFFNLTEEKRANLIEALQKEFSRVPLYEASISNIIKNANIPRGSFYQYFEDKEDAYFFLLNKQLEKSNENFILCLEKCDGDLFDTMIEMYDLTLKEIAVDKNLQLLKNAFLNMTHEIERSFNKVFIAHGNLDQFQKISSLLKITNLNISNETELFHLVKIIATVTLRNLIEKLAKNVPDSEAMDNYKLEINLLKKGLYRNGEEVR
jgi:AcrR family transcriptional regulator